MADTYTERELKFDVGPGFRLPGLTDVLPSGGRIESGSQQLRSDYYDTRDHALLRAQMTLRRRTGSTDVGWQLKVPQEPFREEIRTGPTDDDAVPEELADLLLGVRTGQELVQVASVTTERSVTTLLDADGRRLAEIDDDNVQASAIDDGAATTPTTWREVEVELGGDDLGLLNDLGKRLRRVGARPSASSSKLARALDADEAAGATANTPKTPKAAKAPKARTAKLRAADVVMAYVGQQQRVMLAGDLALRRDQDSAIHQTRVAVRRLRSTLRVFAPFFDERQTADLDAELRWYAAMLGAVRDRQVLRDRLDTAIADVDETLLLGPVRARVDAELQREQSDSWQHLKTELTADRYLNLLANVARWVRQPPITGAARRPTRAIAKLMRRGENRVAQRLRHANETEDTHVLHAARKAAKRARYAAEAAGPVIGTKEATRRAKKYQWLQDLLGEHQDSLVSADLLRRLGATAGATAGENGFAFGLLHERETQRARAIRAKARAAAKHYRS
jgi:CHAD domain-containing protein